MYLVWYGSNVIENYNESVRVCVCEKERRCVNVSITYLLYICDLHTVNVKKELTVNVLKR